MRIAIIGAGKMGRAVAEVARERGHEVGVMVSSAQNAGETALTTERLADVDVAIEFTRPDAVVGNLERLIAIGVPVVTGTTGWSDQLDRVASLVNARGGSLLHAPNFSTGVALLLRAARLVAAEFAGREEFGAFLVDEHHAAKRDAPSGTALALQRALRSGDGGREFPVTSIRGGHHPGRHRITWDSRFETVHLEHAARDRRVFAEGAVRAAEWLPGRRGVFTFDDVLFGRDS